MTENTPAGPQQVDEAFSNLLLTCTKVWEDFVDVHWSRQLYDGRRVLKYQLAAVGEGYRVERYFTQNDTTFRLLGLQPDQEITVRIRTLVESPGDGSGKWCAWASTTVRSLRATSLQVASVKRNQLHGRILWGCGDATVPSTPTHTTVAAAKFQVRVRQKGVILHDVCEKEFAADSSEFLISDLEANAIFEVQARAVSTFGESGRWCSPVRFLTLWPVEVKVAEVGETYGVVQWGRNEDDDNSHTAEGSIEELVVVVELLPNRHELDLDAHAKPVQVDAKSFSNETRVYRVRDLLPGRQYAVRSRYRNVLGDWTEWTSARLATLQPVRLPDIQMVGHNFVQVRWQREEATDSVAGYEETALDVAQWEVRISTGNANTSQTLPERERETKLVNLHPGIDYAIDVRAQTKAEEWGPWSQPAIVTTLHRLTPRVDFAGETWLRVAWDRKERRYNDNITRYHVQLSAVNLPFRVAKYFAATQTTHTFDDLRPGTEYQIVMQAFSDQRWGPWSDPTPTTTCTPCSPTLVRRGEDFVQVRWDCDYYVRNAVEQLDRKYQVSVTRPPRDAPV